jgi:ATP-dependent DNA helicase RecQ
MLEGRALARLTDITAAGRWCRELLAANAPDAPAPRELIAACIRVLADWPWETRPATVVSMPSRSRPLLIDSLAHGIAEAGKLQYLGSLQYAGPGPVGEPGGNSAYRLAAVWNAFAVPDGLVSTAATGPILLIDDVADSRWTLTVASRELRRAGASAVLPFALALRG